MLTSQLMYLLQLMSSPAAVECDIQQLRFSDVTHYTQVCIFDTSYVPQSVLNADSLQKEHASATLAAVCSSCCTLRCPAPCF